MEEKKVSISQVIAIGGAFMGFVIGSSFASGQECMQYFTGHGVLGSIGAGIIALLLYVWFVTVIVEDGRKLKLHNSGKMFNFYLGKYLGFIMEWFTPIMLFFVYSTMISGAGSTFEEYYGVNGKFWPGFHDHCFSSDRSSGAEQAGKDRGIYCSGASGCDDSDRRYLYCK